MKLEQIVAGGGAPAQPGAPAPITEDELRDRLVAQMNAMAEEAINRRMLAVFVQVAAWKLAAIGHRCGPAAIGDILRQLGWQLMAIEEHSNAQREARKARARGHAPH
ncbi:MAG: hypothetical protein AB1773_13485 [Pseudomonadota bacterium]